MSKRKFPWPVNKGGSGSGNFGHGGRPGEVGGSDSGGGSSSSSPKSLKDSVGKIKAALSGSRVADVKIKGNEVHVTAFDMQEFGKPPVSSLEENAKDIFGQIKGSLPKGYKFIGGGIAKPESSSDPIRADRKTYRFGPNGK